MRNLRATRRRLIEDLVRAPDGGRREPRITQR
jgi:hypothetical protein